MAISAELQESTIRHQVFLERLKTGEANQFAAFLKRIDESIKGRLLSKDLTEFSRARLERLLESVDKSLLKIYDDYRDELSGNLIDTAIYESEFEARNLTSAVANFEAVIPTAAQVRASVLSQPLSVRGTDADGGKLLDSFIEDFTTNERKHVVNSIRQGYFEGQTTAQIVRNIRGTKKNNFSDGILAISSRNAEAIVRTSVQHVASTARMETLKLNDSVVTGYRISATLDSRTTTICRSLDNQTFKIGQGPVTPLHIGCRSTMVAELDGRFDFLKQGKTRSSINGAVDGNQTYYEWLKTQPAEFQDSAIGPVRAKLLRDGGLSAKRFADLNLSKNFQPLTLVEMRKLEPLAFKNAGI